MGNKGTLADRALYRNYPSVVSSGRRNTREPAQAMATEEIVVIVGSPEIVL